MKTIEKYLLPMSDKLSENRYLKAIRDGFAAILPLIIAASLCTLINAVVIGEAGFTNKLFGQTFPEVQAVCNSINVAIMNVIAILLTFTITKSLANEYGDDTNVAAVTAVVAFFVLTPIGKNAEIEKEIIETAYLGSKAMFMSFIISFLTVELMRMFSRVKIFIIHMPENVPPAIAKSFNKLIPVVLTVFVFGFVRFICNANEVNLNDLIFAILQAPFSNLVSSPIGIGVIYFFYMLLWGMGIHSASIFSAIVNPVYIANIAMNEEVVRKGVGTLQVMTKPFLNGMAFMGGAGNMLALIVAIFIVSNRKDYREISKIGFVPAIFNISEPVMFGLPVVMNPLLIIPMIATTLISLVLGALATKVGLMAYTTVLTPWITPPILMTYLATGGHFMSAVVALVIFVISVLTYMPFVAALNTRKEK